MIATIVPPIREQITKAVNDHGLIGASYHLDRLRAEIDIAKCREDNRNVRHSLIRKITAQRYQELRHTWDQLTN